MEVPPISTRLELVQQAHATCGYADGRHLVELLRSRYFWSGMSRDCIAVAAASLASQIEKTKFKRPRYLFPTEKGAAPFRYYALDCFVGLTPAAPNGRTAVVIAIDLFTKWLEYCILAHLDSYHVA